MLIHVCSGHGECDAVGKCWCDVAWRGDKCEIGPPDYTIAILATAGALLICCCCSVIFSIYRRRRQRLGERERKRQARKKLRSKKKNKGGKKDKKDKSKRKGKVDRRPRVCTVQKRRDNETNFNSESATGYPGTGTGRCKVPVPSVELTMLLETPRQVLTAVVFTMVLFQKTQSFHPLHAAYS